MVVVKKLKGESEDRLIARFKKRVLDEGIIIEARERKEFKPKDTAMDMATAMGVEILTEEEYHELRKLGKGEVDGGKAHLAAPVRDAGQRRRGGRAVRQPGELRLFADSPAVYSDRAIKLVNESLVIDMLSLLDMGRLFQAQATGYDPFSFSREELLAVRDSGIDVFHPATGLGGPEAAVDVLTHMAGYNRLIGGHPDLLMRIDSVADIDAVRATARSASCSGSRTPSTSARWTKSSASTSSGSASRS